MLDRWLTWCEWLMVWEFHVGNQDTERKHIPDGYYFVATRCRRA